MKRSGRARLVIVATDALEKMSISQDLVGREGQEVSIDYELAPGWELGTVTSSSGQRGGYHLA
ncbi:MAG: hypothetical protein ACREYC_06760 [Gammaproteobacteria bacterium]